MKRPPKQKVTPAQLALSPGDSVVVRMDDGTKKFATVVNTPWQLGHGDWVIKVSGISGGYDLERVHKLKATSPPTCATEPIAVGR